MYDNSRNEMHRKPSMWWTGQATAAAAKNKNWLENRNDHNDDRIGKLQIPSTTSNDFKQ